MPRGAATVVYCSDPPIKRKARKGLALDYRRGSARRNVVVRLPDFVLTLQHVPDRVLDLLEIAAYVYGADRYTSRGAKTAVEYHSWSRCFEFHVRVRDQPFWSAPATNEVLTETLEFLMGNQEIRFSFHPGHTTLPTNLFDFPWALDGHPTKPVRVVPFSGGLDSLAGALRLLDHSGDSLLLVSHQSQPTVKRTQNALLKALRLHYPQRIYHFPFECHLTGDHGVQETQRSRGFLYCSIAFAVASVFGADTIDVCENGVTSLNLARRQDLLNARASRTTHPRTLDGLGRLFSLVGGKSVAFAAPLQFSTKAAVFRALMSSRHPELISSAVSCGRTYQRTSHAPQCGDCFQCIDRRIAAFAAGAEGWDHEGLYSRDIVRDTIASPEARTVLLDYIRQAIRIRNGNADSFAQEYFAELSDIIPSLHGAESDTEKVERLWELYRNHATDVIEGLKRIQASCEDLGSPLAPKSLLALLADRAYLAEDPERLAAAIATLVQQHLPPMFRKGNKPTDENDLNQKMAALISSHHADLQSEAPAQPFACARVIPDHTTAAGAVLVEAKYLRTHTTPSKATDGIAADITKYPEAAFILFVVYDPDGSIPNDCHFRLDIERRGRCRIEIVR